MSSRFDGAGDYNDQRRPEHGFPLHPAWLSAILAGHAKVALGLHIDAAVLTLLSWKSALLPRWNTMMLTSDAALDVEQVAQSALRLGNAVTVVRLESALHDVTLSAQDVRERAFAETTRWLLGYFR